MKKTIPICFLLIIVYINLSAQHVLYENENKLESKNIVIKNNYFKVTPVINYSFNDRSKIEIVLNGVLKDKKRELIENKREWLFLISDWEQFLKHYKDEGFIVDRKPTYVGLIEKSKAVEVWVDGKKSHTKEFNNGFSDFQTESNPIRISVEYIPGSEITLKFNFVHITASHNKIKINGPPQPESWKIRLPSLTQTKSVDCDKLISHYITDFKDITNDRDLTFFKGQLKFQNVDIVKLRGEFKVFKETFRKVEDIRKVIGYNKDIDQCPDSKKQLFLQIDSYLQQRSSLSSFEDKIKNYEKNVCKNYYKKYRSRLNIIKSDKDLDYMQAKINDPKTNVLKLDDEFRSLTKEMRSFQQLKNQISGDPNSAKCSKKKSQLLTLIAKYKIEQEEMEEIESLIKNKMEKLAENKELEFKAYTNKYISELAIKKEEYQLFLSRLLIKESVLDENYLENNSRISALHKYQKNSETSPDLDTLKLVKELLSFSIFENKKSLDTIAMITKHLNDYKNDVDLLMQKCKSQFDQIEKKQGSIKAEPLLIQYEKFMGEIVMKKGEIEYLYDKIKDNYQQLNNFNDHFNPAKQLINQQVVTKYISLFDANLKNLNQLDTDFKKLQNDFEDKRYRKTYYKWVKKSLIKRTINIEEKLNSYSNKQDTLKVQKSLDFEKNAIPVYIEQINKFEQTASGLPPRIEYLYNNIEKSPYQKFPYVYVLLGIVSIVILVFGAKVYITAIRSKKRKQTKKNNQTKSAISKITIKESNENSDEKGKGLDEIVQKHKNEYLEIDLIHEWNDTAVSRVYFKRDCIIKTYRFFEDSLMSTDTDKTAYETGGFLVGRWDNNPDEKGKFDVSLEDFIEPGNDAKFSNYQLNFGAKIGVKLQKVLTNLKQKTGIDYVMTAWFHSHPGLKIFLSDYDLSVQEGFSHDRRSLKMLAIVLDPYTKDWDTGIFTYKADGSEMNNSNDSKRFFSLDSMYKWALNPSVKVSESHFKLNLSEYFSDSVCEMLYFENSIILEIKRLSEDNNNEISPISFKHISGRLITKKYNHFDLILENLIDTTENKEGLESSTIGLFIDLTEGSFNIGEILKKPELQNEKVLVLVIYHRQENRIIVTSRMTDFKFNLPSDKAILLLDEMIDWTRKRK